MGLLRHQIPISNELVTNDRCDTKLYGKRTNNESLYVLIYTFIQHDLHIHLSRFSQEILHLCLCLKKLAFPSVKQLTFEVYKILNDYFQFYIHVV